MKKKPLVLPFQPPRAYTLRQAYQGRVWRTPVSVLSREIFFWMLGLALIGIALNHVTIMWWSGVGAGVSGLTACIASILDNRARVEIICRGAAAKAVLGRPRRIPMMHELFRGQKESTYRLPYTFRDEGDNEIKGSIWLCGCARQYLPVGSVEMVAYDPNKTTQSVPLRVAVMVAPH